MGVSLSYKWSIKKRMSEWLIFIVTCSYKCRCECFMFYFVSIERDISLLLYDSDELEGARTSGSEGELIVF